MCVCLKKNPKTTGSNTLQTHEAISRCCSSWWAQRSKCHVMRLNYLWDSVKCLINQKQQQGFLVLQKQHTQQLQVADEDYLTLGTNALLYQDVALNQTFNSCTHSLEMRQTIRGEGVVVHGLPLKSNKDNAAARWHWLNCHWPNQYEDVLAHTHSRAVTAYLITTLFPSPFCS